MAAINLFPARVVTPDGVNYPVARIDTRKGQVRVWSVVDNQPTLIAEWPQDQVDTPRGKPGLIALAADGTEIRKGAGCGCRHPLKRFRPPVDTTNARKVNA